MSKTGTSDEGPARRLWNDWRFWTILAILAATTLLHYTTPQTRLLAPHPNTFLSRHAAERILFLIPIAGAALAFGKTAGAIATVVAIAAALPRAIWLSPNPADALLEVLVIGVVGHLVVLIINVETREKDLRQRAISRLRVLNRIAGIAVDSLEPDAISERTLSEVLDIVSAEAGLIFLVDRQTGDLVPVAHQGIPETSIADFGQVGLDEGLCGQAMRSGESRLFKHASQDPQFGPIVNRYDPPGSLLLVPLRSKQAVQGLMALAEPPQYQFRLEELELIAAISSQMGIAIENAHLYENMRFYAHQITRAQEQERKRIAREFHDEAIQMLIVIGRRLEALASSTEQLPDDTKQSIEAIQQMISETSTGIRRFVRDLRPPTLDHLGLVATLRSLVKELREESDIEVEFAVSGEPQRLAADEELELFRIAQEALNNVRRHSGAHRVSVCLDYRPDVVSMVLEDNGCGFSAPSRPGALVSSGRLGLIGMHERARALGGQLTIDSEPGQFTRVSACVPVRPRMATANGNR